MPVVAATFAASGAFNPAHKPLAAAIQDAMSAAALEAMEAGLAPEEQRGLMLAAREAVKAEWAKARTEPASEGG